MSRGLVTLRKLDAQPVSFGLQLLGVWCDRGQFIICGRCQRDAHRDDQEDETSASLVVSIYPRSNASPFFASQSGSKVMMPRDMVIFLLIIPSTARATFG